MVDYLLNVAVGISAGVGALTSAVPGLHANTLPLCLGILGMISLVNLRGTKESGLALAIAALWTCGTVRPHIVIPLERWDRLAHRAIHVATRLSPDVVALHLSDLEGPDAVEHEMRLRLEWTRFSARRFQVQRWQR